MAIPGCWVPWWSNPSELRVGGPPHTFLQVQGCGCGKGGAAVGYLFPGGNRPLSLVQLSPAITALR